MPPERATAAENEAIRARAIGWLQRGEVGISSETIWRVLMGETPQRADIPYDPDDFSRCHKLLGRIPEWRARLGEVAAAYPRWAPFVAAWDELTALYEDELVNGPVVKGTRMAPKTHARMKQLRGDAGASNGR